MDRTSEDATVKVVSDDDLKGPTAHVPAFDTACNFAERLEALCWKTPFRKITPSLDLKTQTSCGSPRATSSR